MTAPALLELDAIQATQWGGSYLLRAGKAAKFLDVSEETFRHLRKLLAPVYLPDCKHARFRIADLIEFADKYVKKPKKLRRGNQKNIVKTSSKALEFFISTISPLALAMDAP